MKHFETIVIAPPRGEHYEFKGHVVITLCEQKFYSHPAWEIQIVEDEISGDFFVIRSWWEIIEYGSEPYLSRLAIDVANSVQELVQLCKGYKAVMEALYAQSYLVRPHISSLIERFSGNRRNASSRVGYLPELPSKLLED